MIRTDIEGSIVKAAIEGKVDIVAQACDCCCKHNTSVNLIMSKAFHTENFPMEQNEQDEADASHYMPEVGKLGCIDFRLIKAKDPKRGMWVVNMYTQLQNEVAGAYGIPFDYDAFRLCLRKLKLNFPGLSLGLPGMFEEEGADSQIVREIINQETVGMRVTIYHPSITEKLESNGNHY